MDGLVPQVVVQQTGPDSEVFQLTLHNGLLEVAGESEHFPVILEPLGLDPGDILVDGLGPLLLEGGGALGLEGVE